jgi:serine/threonine protein kinase
MYSLQSGDQLDHYHIESLAAQSGMASIYRATDLRNDRAVAIKVPHLQVESDPLFYDRFKREEEIGRKLDHPGVMKVFDDEDRSRVYMVMEWVDGRSLTAHPDRTEETSRRAGGTYCRRDLRCFGVRSPQWRCPPRFETGKRHGRLRRSH